MVRRMGREGGWWSGDRVLAAEECQGQKRARFK